MAEALAILGGVAASVQLIETTVKAASELYNTFRSLETAERDSQREITLLDEVRATLAQVSGYILSVHGTHELETTPDLSLLSQHVQTLCTELKEVKDLVPTDVKTNYRARIKWASRRKIFDERIRNIEGQKLLLVLSLQTLSR
ncbi:hypothetical protein BCR34DRAFT_391394 [Clohesyomyces aquaticus]|uniref:Uncharacterized protein n=1 Tax=Clohesyomyces aquaticus TaxID=1231657 RepID=A0A1Y1ZER3_9PLEO|nr:hypothetical protein BCR34DRAFT_391394 [Clohesyomyces aquaticus]